MGKLTRSQKKQRKLKRKREARKRRKEILDRRTRKYKPWVTQKMRFFEMPKLFRDDVPKATRINAIREIGKKAKDDFAAKYPLLQKWFEDYDALYVLSFCAFYFMSFPEGTDLEAEGTIEIYQHYVELMQAFSLVKPRSLFPKPLLQDAEHLKDDLKEIGELMQMRFLDIPEKISSDEDLHSFMLRVGMMEHTIAVRNWAYPHQIKKVVSDLAALVKDALYYRFITRKQNGWIETLDTAVKLGKSPTEVVAFLKNPENEESLSHIKGKVEQYWNS